MVITVFRLVDRT